MAQVIRTLCDVCMNEGNEVEGAPTGFGLRPGMDGRWTWAMVDLCPEHEAANTVALGAFMDKYGHPLSKPPKVPAGKGAPKAGTRAATHTAPVEASSDNLVCPKCGFTSSNRNALRSHVKDRHEGITLDQLEGTPTPYACPHCTKAFTRQQALALHLTRIHGADSEAASG